MISDTIQNTNKKRALKKKKLEIKVNIILILSNTQSQRLANKSIVICNLEQYIDTKQIRLLGRYAVGIIM